MRVLTYRKQYLFLTILLLLTEIFIALYVHDRIIRPYIGDLLVVILIYCFIMSFFRLSVGVAAVSTLLFAYIIELCQHLNIIKAIGLQHSKLANIILGNSFEWIDMAAYTLGFIIVLISEYLRVGQHKKTVTRL